MADPCWAISPWKCEGADNFLRTSGRINNLIYLPQPLRMSLVPVRNSEFDGYRLSIWNSQTLDKYGEINLTNEWLDKHGGVRKVYNEFYEYICNIFHNAGVNPPVASTWY